MWWLYVSGLSHTVTQKDLKDRFGKFGDVEDMELRTRKDEDAASLEANQKKRLQFAR
uniref:RRM domain-containing protein n=1 Tax=Amphiprion ocellaris TaxID=80972 RepID=A0AAQ6AFE1_AMPOC